MSITLSENGKIVVYNASSGRKAKSSEYSRGIQQALEAKEGLQIHTESVNGDEMSILDMVRKFDKVSGCSGTVRELNDYFEDRFGKVYVKFLLRLAMQLMKHRSIFYIKVPNNNIFMRIS